MFSTQWLVDQVLLSYASPAAFLAAQDPQVINRLSNGPNFFSLPKDVLAHVLSYIGRKDVLSCMRVCKAFLEASQKPQFWARLVREKLEEVIGGWDDSYDADDRKCMRLFNTFMSPKPESLRDQVEWIYRRGWIQLTFDKTNPSINCIARRSSDWNILTYIIEKTLQNIDWVRWFVCSKKDWNRSETGQICFVRFKNEKEIHNADVAGFGLPGTGCFTNDNDDVFVGECAVFDKEYVPHGSGKWKFADGTVLEGEGVAWKGEPREPVKRRKLGE